MSLFFVLHVCFGSVLFVKAGYGRQFMWGKDVKLTEKQLRFQNSKLFKYGNVTTYTPLYFGLLTIVSLFFNSDIDKSFLFVTMGYWFLSSRQLGISLKDTWPKSGILLRFMICIGVFLSFLLYVNIFSITQFGKIPKGVGGGKPENVYLVFSSQHCGAAESMNLHKVNNLRSTNSIFGPVGIILKTENEITFINYSELNTPKVFTNGFRLIYTTNLAVTSISHTNSNPANPISTNIVDDTRPNVFYNSGGLAARQIRADLIDGIIYSR
jgi:hypothetical protein